MKKEFKEMLKERGRTEMPNVLLVSAECAPLSKTGGLADVVGTLPKALKKLGIDARVNAQGAEEAGHRRPGHYPIPPLHQE